MSAPAKDSASALGASELAALFDARAERTLRATRGRETFVWTPRVGGAACIVKRYPGIPLVARWSSTRSAGRREYENLARLTQLGASVPRPLGFCEQRAAPWRSLVVMERIAHDETLRERLARVEVCERERLGRELLGLVARLHAAGWHHRDLYLQHVLVRASDGALVLIDVERARHARSVRARWFVKDLAALLHSTPPAVTGRERLRFLARWLTAHGVRARERRRAWLTAIVRKAARMAAHVPRDERPE